MPDIGKLLRPESVAVVGASSDLQGLRGRILETILSHPFAGRVYPVSRSGTDVQGLKAYPSVDTLPEPADLAILIIPAQYVPTELERCGRAGIKAAMILSSGAKVERIATAATSAAKDTEAAIHRRRKRALTAWAANGTAATPCIGLIAHAEILLVDGQGNGSVNPGSGCSAAFDCSNRSRHDEREIALQRPLFDHPLFFFEDHRDDGKRLRIGGREIVRNVVKQSVRDRASHVFHR